MKTIAAAVLLISACTKAEDAPCVDSASTLCMRESDYSVEACGNTEEILETALHLGYTLAHPDSIYARRTLALLKKHEAEKAKATEAAVRGAFIYAQQHKSKQPTRQELQDQVDDLQSQLNKSKADNDEAHVRSRQ